jgi:predicted DNA-binding protein with PD1-like motif
MRRLSVLGLYLFVFIQCNINPPMEKETYRFHPLRLKPGADLKGEIEAYVKREKIEAGWMSTCVGSLTVLQVRFANQPEADTLEGHMEIVSLTGTVSVNGSHLHISVSDSMGKTIGGHLMPGSKVYTTAELVIGESLRHKFTREEDGTTPWKELQIKTKD